MTTLVLVGGTWTQGDRDWTSPASPLRIYLMGKGYHCIQFQGWSGDIDGIPTFGENGPHADWKAGGFGLSYLLQAMPYEDRNVIAHSHGGNTAVYTPVLAGCPILTLTTVCTPVRKDMLDVYREAKPNIGHWTHIYADGWDLMQRLGEMFDGAFGWTREMPDADRNVGIKGISHSKLLNEAKWFPQLVDLLQKETV